MQFENKNIFDENPLAADNYRQNYVDGCLDYIAQMGKEAKIIRQNQMNEAIKSGNIETCRRKYIDMIGIDKFAKSTKEVQKVYIGKDDVCDIYRLTIYITDNIPFYAMLLIPFGVQNSPLIITQHGGGGTPELCCDFNGKNNYNHMVQRALKRGAVVVAPQLMLWSMNESDTTRAHNVKYGRLSVDSNLKRFGSSITGLEVTGIMRAIDYAVTLPEVDENQIRMVGLSYGSYYTLHTMAADTRIKAGYCVAEFNDKDKYDWMDWSYRDSAKMFQDAEVAALCAPRRLYIQVGKADEVFDYHYSIEEADRAKRYYEASGCADNFKFVVWDGGHTLPDDDNGFDFITNLE